MIQYKIQSGLTKDKRLVTRNFCQEMIGILPKYNTMNACQLQSMSGTLLGMCCKMSATVQNKVQVSHLPRNVSYYHRYIIPRNVRYIVHIL